MNYKLVIRLLVMMPLLIQGSPDDSSPAPSSTNRVPGVSPWILGTAVTCGCYWAYNQWYLSPEKEFNQGALAFRECMRNNQDNSMNEYGLPSACEDSLINFALARNALRNRQGAPTTQAMVKSFQEN